MPISKFPPLVNTPLVDEPDEIYPWKRWHVDAPQDAFPVPRPMSAKRSPYEKLAARLDLDHGSTFPFEHVHIVETSSQFHVLIKQNDQVVLLVDDRDLFPSDALIGKIRLLQ